MGALLLGGTEEEVEREDEAMEGVFWVGMTDEGTLALGGLVVAFSEGSGSLVTAGAMEGGTLALGA